MSYTPPTNPIDATWVGADGYHTPFSVVPGAWGAAAPSVYAVGFAAGGVGVPPLVTKQQFANPASWVSATWTAPLVTLAGEYIPPFATVDAAWAGADAYTPAAGTLDASWLAATPGDDQYVYAGGDAHGAFGAAFVTQQQFVGPVGFGIEAFGRPRARREGEYLPPDGYGCNASWVGALDYIPPLEFILARWGDTPANSVRPVGQVHGAFGHPSLLNQHQWVIPYSLDAFEGFGAHWVSLGTRRINAGLGDQSAFGRAELSGGTRWLDLAGRGIAGSIDGRPSVWFREREVFPDWFVATQYGQAQVDRHHGVEPAGFEVGDFGRPEVHVPRDYVDLAGLGIAGPLWGENTARNAIEYLHPNGIGPWPGEHERFGRPEVQLWTRYVQQLYEVTPGDGGVFGNFNLVENRDKVPRPEGWVSSRYGTPEIYNNARIVTTPPHQDMSLWGDTLVAYRIRTIHPQGDDTSQWGSPLGNIIYNAARVLAPQGFESSVAGRPERVWSNLQWMDHAGGEDYAGFGEAMVAFAIRTVSPYSLPEPPSAGFATVENWQRYIMPPGIDAGRYGVPTLEEHFTIIAAKSVLPPAHQVADGARVWNLTPELRQMGAVHTEWGRAQVFNQWEAYAFEGFRTTAFGRHAVRDRRIWIAPSGVAPRQISPLHRVRNVDPDPPSTRTVAPEGWNNWSDQRIGRPEVRSNVIAPDGLLAFLSTPPVVTYYGISPESINPFGLDGESFFGTPSLPNAQHVGHYHVGEPSPFGLPDVGPRYVWAPRGYPYTTGYWLEEGRLINSEVVFGHATVTHRHRVIAHTHDVYDNFGDQARYGEPRFSLNPQYVMPDGLLSFRRGVPEVGGAERTVDTFGFDMAMVPPPSVGFGQETGPQTVAPPGFAGAFGKARMEFFNRELVPAGFIAFQISPPRPPSWPRESHWISHEYPPFEMTGLDATLWGTTWISHRIRHLETEGWDSAIVADYEPGYFNLRMRVRRDDYVRDASAGMQGGIGLAEVTHGTRNLLAWAIYDGRVGTPSARAEWRVAPAGWDSQVFGNIDRWEAGTIKAHGDDLAAYGRAVIHRALQAGGFDAATLGTPGMGRRIAVAGSDTAMVAVPAAIGGGCCNRGDRVAVPGGFDATGFGVPNIGDELAAVIGAGEIRPAGWLATNPGVGPSFAGHNVTQTQPKRQETENA